MTGTVPPVAEQSTGQSGTADKDSYALGEQIVVEGVTYTVTERERAREIGDQVKAREGNEFAFYEIAIHNTGSVDSKYSQSDYSIVTGAGEIKSNYLFIDINDKNGNLGNGDLAAGGKRSGWVAFELRQGDQPLELRFEKKNRTSSASFKIKLQ